MDADGDGKLYPEELKTYLGSIGKYGTVEVECFGDSECDEIQDK